MLLVYEADKFINCQPLAMRAPEVFLRHRCAEPAQVWAIAAMLLVWMKPGFFGVRHKPKSSPDEAWCIVKLKRLFPEWRIPLPSVITNEVLKSTISAAFAMYKSSKPEEKVLQETLPFDAEMGKVEMPQELRSLLRIMLVTDPQKRPSASSVLASAEYQAFATLVD
jgi:serine/threonine protein kinase